MILLNNTKVTPTVFPDNTSQVWKKLETMLKSKYKGLPRWSGKGN